MIFPAVIMKLKSVLRGKKSTCCFGLEGVVSQSYACSLDKKSNTYCHASWGRVYLCVRGTQSCAGFEKESAVVWVYMFIP